MPMTTILKYAIILEKNLFLDWNLNFSSKNICLTTDHEVAGSIPGTFTKFKCGLGLERDPPSLVRTIGQLLD